MLLERIFLTNSLISNKVQKNLHIIYEFVFDPSTATSKKVINEGWKLSQEILQTAPLRLAVTSTNRSFSLP